MDQNGWTGFRNNHLTIRFIRVQEDKNRLSELQFTPSCPAPTGSAGEMISENDHISQ